MEQIENILKIQIKPLEACDMYDKTQFTTSAPVKPIPKTFSREPLREDSIYNPPMSFFTSISKKKKQAFIDENDDKFNLDHKKWQEECDKILNDNSNDAALYSEEFEKWEKVITQRRELFVDYEIPLGEDYRKFVLQFFDED